MENMSTVGSNFKGGTIRDGAEFKKLCSLVLRNTKCYFKDKFTFFMSMITPIILFILFVTFLRNVYIEQFTSSFKANNIVVDPKIIEGCAGAWLMSSILSVSAVTVAFCSNTIMIDDRINSAVNDFRISPVKGTTISLSYFISNFLVTTVVLVVVMLIGHVYLACVGWYISLADTFMVIVDILCLVLFGTLLAGVVESFIKTQGGLSAVSTLVSSMYGFICGAYMPISSFSAGLQNVLSLLPGTYGVGIMRNHYLNGYMAAFIEEMRAASVDENIISEVINGIRDSFDANLYSFGTDIGLGAMFGILLGTCCVLLAVYVLIVILKNKKKKAV
ncbi:MAG: ABC transporter permease [Clostridia bacterium]|nr:ABC transporter permease [Clostridia bacterium]